MATDVDAVVTNDIMLTWQQTLLLTLLLMLLLGINNDVDTAVITDVIASVVALLLQLLTMLDIDTGKLIMSLLWRLELPSLLYLLAAAAPAYDSSSLLLSSS